MWSVEQRKRDDKARTRDVSKKFKMRARHAEDMIDMSASFPMNQSELSHQACLRGQLPPRRFWPLPSDNEPFLVTRSFCLSHHQEPANERPLHPKKTKADEREALGLAER